jgi:hypothetical protein
MARATNPETVLAHHAHHRIEHACTLYGAAGSQPVLRSEHDIQQALAREEDRRPLTPPWRRSARTVDWSTIECIDLTSLAHPSLVDAAASTVGTTSLYQTPTECVDLTGLSSPVHRAGFPSLADLTTPSSPVDHEDDIPSSPCLKRKRGSSHSASPSSDTQREARSAAVSAHPRQRPRLVLQAPLRRSDPRYLHGAVRRIRHRRLAGHWPEDVTLEGVLRPMELQQAILSSMQWDPSWVFASSVGEGGALPPTLWIMHGRAASGQHSVAMLRREGIKNPTVRFPRLQSHMSVMHSKLMLLWHQQHLRVVLPTANLTALDWGEQAREHVENSAFLLDLPRRSTQRRQGRAHAALEASNTPFRAELLRFLAAQQVPQPMRDQLQAFDFSASTHLAFVHSM